jgi:hypothetical protein
VAAFLSRHGWLALVLGVAALVFSPAVRAPLLADDYVQVAMLSGTFPSPRSPFDLYDFVTEADRGLLLERGVIPWWSDPQLTIRFFRPLSSALRWVDHALYGDAPLPAHLHSVVYWAIACLAIHALHRRAFGERAGRIATAVFALAPCHGIPLAWLSNREALISLAFGALALDAHLRVLRGEARFRGAAALPFAISLLAGEYALAFVGYFAALELVRPSDRLAARALRLAPLAGLAAAYLVARRIAHAATVGSGFYRDPFDEPLRFLATAPTRLATVFVDAWFASHASSWGVPRWALVVLALAIGAVLVSGLVQTARGLPAPEQLVLRAFVLGSFLALIPVLAVAPDPRTLGVATVGVAGAVGVVVDRAWFRVAATDARAELARGLAAVLVFARLVYAPLTTYQELSHVRTTALEFQASLRAVEAQRATDGDVNVLRGDWSVLLWAPFAMNDRHVAPPRWRVLSLTRHALVRRPDERTLEIVAPRDVGLFPFGEDDLFRSEENPLPTGTEVRVAGVSATTFELPKSVGLRIVFDGPIDDGFWIAQRGNAVERVEPPSIGFGRPLDR